MVDVRTKWLDWWEVDGAGRHLWALERAFIVPTLADAGGSRILVSGCLPYRAAADMGVLQGAYGADVLAACGSLPWCDGAFDAVVLAHETDFAADVGRLLAEAYRVVRPYGCVVLTGFNPYSLWRWGAAAQWVRASPSLPEIKARLPETGWRVAGGRFMNYLPPCVSKRALWRWRFMEQAGNRWWPHAAAVYGLVLHKRPLGVRLRGEAAAEGVPDGVVWATARYGE